MSFAVTLEDKIEWVSHAFWIRRKWLPRDLKITRWKFSVSVGVGKQWIAELSLCSLNIHHPSKFSRSTTGIRSVRNATKPNKSCDHERNHTYRVGGTAGRRAWSDKAAAEALMS